jgi:hypothetical protein
MFCDFWVCAHLRQDMCRNVVGAFGENWLSVYLKVEIAPFISPILFYSMYTWFDVFYL